MNNAHEARVIGRSLPVSTKHVIEISKFIRGRTVEQSKALLQRVLEFKTAIPYKKFGAAGHKPGIGSGRYPQKATKEVLKLLNSLEANAQNKGLDTKTIYIKTIMPNRGETQPRYGRNRGTAKRTHLTIIAEEKQIPQKKVKPKETKK